MRLIIYSSAKIKIIIQTAKEKAGKLLESSGCGLQKAGGLDYYYSVHPNLFFIYRFLKLCEILRILDY